MRWQNKRRSDNIEDQRGQSPAAGGGSPNAALLRLLPMLLGRKGGKFSLIIVLLIFGASYFGIDLGMLSGTQNASSGSSAPHRVTPQEQQLADFVAVVLADTEDTWHPIFKQLEGTYREPKLVLFANSVQSACGMAQSAMGPFYCPADQKVYIDLSFYDDLRQRHGAPGDFAQAYVIAHEVGHHVQTLLGISQQVHQAKQKVSKVQANQLSVKQELQADCFAGIWANHAERLRNMLEAGDIDEALTAAAAIGDDRLQKQARGYVTPDSFTHGSSAQRIRWFKQGYQQGKVDACNTFAAS
jgi:uncharacterized protein